MSHAYLLIKNKENNIMKEQISFIQTTYRTLKDLQSPAFWDLFLDVIKKYKKDFGLMGQTISYANHPRYKPIVKEEILKAINDNKPSNSVHICFGGNKPYNFKIDFNLQNGEIVRNRHSFSFVDVRINSQYFMNENKAKNLNHWLVLCTELYDLFDPLCAFSHDDNDYVAIISGTHTDQPHIDCPISGIFWANFFGPCCIEFFGKDRLLKAPGIVKLEELKNGGMLVLTGPDPLEPNNPKNEKNQYELWKYLGLKPLPKRGKAVTEISFKDILKLPEILLDLGKK